MAKKRKRLTENQKLFEQLKSEYYDKISYLANLGIDVSSIDLPVRPKYITKKYLSDLKIRLSSIPDEQLIYPEIDNVIISQWIDTNFERFPGAVIARDIVTNFINNLLQDNTPGRVAIMLQDALDNGLILTYEDVYETSKLNDFLMSLLEYLPNTTSIEKSFYLDQLSAIDEITSTVYDEDLYE